VTQLSLTANTWDAFSSDGLHRFELGAEWDPDKRRAR